MGKRLSTPSDPIVAELTAIKRLLILDLLRGGLNQKQIAVVLGMDGSQLSRELKGVGKSLKNTDKGDK